MELSGYVDKNVYKLLSEVGYSRYIGKKPTKKVENKYFTINSFRVPADVFQSTYCNVNCHVKDLGDGVRDQNSLDQMAEAAKLKLDKTRIMGQVSLIIDLADSEIIPDTALGEHYYNLKFYVTIANN